LAGERKKNKKIELFSGLNENRVKRNDGWREKTKGKKKKKRENTVKQIASQVEGCCEWQEGAPGIGKSKMKKKCEPREICKASEKRP